jgi:hypothetical protein
MDDGNARVSTQNQSLALHLKPCILLGVPTPVQVHAALTYYCDHHDAMVLPSSQPTRRPSTSDTNTLPTPNCSRRAQQAG